MPNKNFVSKVIVSTLPAFFIAAVVFAWTEPSSAPPTGNVPAPLNVSGTSQTKSGELTFPKMVDYNDTGYYVDPHANSWLYRIYSYDIRSDIYYDRNNTAFYLDPAGTSNINRMQFNYYPTDANDAATKGYVDAQVGGLRNYKQAYRSATTVDGTASVSCPSGMTIMAYSGYVHQYGGELISIGRIENKIIIEVPGSCSPNPPTLDSSTSLTCAPSGQGVGKVAILCQN